MLIATRGIQIQIGLFSGLTVTKISELGGVFINKSFISNELECKTRVYSIMYDVHL